MKRQKYDCKRRFFGWSVHQPTVVAALFMSDPCGVEPDDVSTNRKLSLPNIVMFFGYFITRLISNNSEDFRADYESLVCLKQNLSAGRSDVGAVGPCRYIEITRGYSLSNKLDWFMFLSIIGLASVPPSLYARLNDSVLSTLPPSSTKSKSMF